MSHQISKLIRPHAQFLAAGSHLLASGGGLFGDFGDVPNGKRHFACISSLLYRRLGDLGDFLGGCVNAADDLGERSSRFFA